MYSTFRNECEFSILIPASCIVGVARGAIGVGGRGGSGLGTLDQGVAGEVISQTGGRTQHFYPPKHQNQI